MAERCRCGTELLPGLRFCVNCGTDRASGAVQAPAASPSVPGRAPTPWAEPSGTALRPAPVPPSPTAWPGAVTHAGAAPTQARPWSPGPWLVALSVVLVVLLSAGAVLVTLRPALVFGEESPVVAPAAAAPADPAAPAAQPFMPAVVPTASDELRDQVDRDRGRVESVTGLWVPQLSSKRPGTVDNGIRYDDTTILSHYRGLAARYPGAALLWSGDWPVFKGDDYWVVIVAQPFATPAQANAWCDQQGFGADDCLAKNLSHTGGPAGTTVNR